MRWFGWFRAPPPRPQVTLLCMRLVEMRFVHPQQITKHCSKCGEEVGIYPSGQRVLAWGEVEVMLVCHQCHDGSVGALAPGAEFEPFQSVERE